MTDNLSAGCSSLDVVTGSQVVLTEFGAQHAEFVASLVGDDRVTSSLSFDSRNRSQAQIMLDGIIERRLARPRVEYYLVVAPRETPNAAVGFVRLGLNGVRAAELGYAVGADHWGKGYATDAARTMISFGFRSLGLHRISAAIGPNNQASITVVEKLNFRYEGRIRDHVFTNGAWRDSLLYSTLEHEQDSCE